MLFIQFLIYTHLLIYTHSIQLIHTYNTQCFTNQYYDIASLTCQYCNHTGGYDLIPDSSITDMYGNMLSCICRDGYMEIENDCSQDTSGTCQGITCVSCLSSGNTSYSDDTSCVPCGATTGGLEDGECTCPEVLLETDAAGNKLPSKQCGDCPAGKGVISVSQKVAGVWLEANPYACQSCPDEHMSMAITGDVASCSCASGYTKVGQTVIGSQSCLLTSLASPFVSSTTQASQVTYSIGTRTSTTIQHYYAKAATGCTYYGSPENNFDCQVLANLCVLHLYDSDALPCSTFASITAGRDENILNGIPNWGYGMPWLYYSDSGNPCKDKSVQMKMNLDSLHLQYVVAKYAMNGTFIGYEDVETLFSYCPRAAPASDRGGGTSSSTQWQIFGSTEYLSFKCDLFMLLDQEQFFYDLYLLDSKTGGLVPVPVRVTNLKQDGSSPNSLRVDGEVCASGEVHVRRFMLFDIVSGLTDASFQTPLSDGSYAPVVVRYADTIFLDVQIREDDPEQIYVPVLTIQYKDASTSGWESRRSEAYTETHFDARYSMNTDDFFSILDGFFIAGIVLFVLLFLLRYFNWRTRNTRPLAAVAVQGQGTNGLTLSVLMDVSAIAMHCWVQVFFPMTLLVCQYWFVFFKIQDTVAVMLPPMEDIYSSGSDYNVFVSMLHLLFFFQLGYVAHMVYRQANADIFFIDWEPSKSKAKDGTGGVSVWRTILVANEWNEMQSIRRTDVRFSLLFIGFFLIGLGLENNATQQPDLDNLQDGRHNIILRFANTTWWWFVVSSAQLLWRFIIYERYISEPKEQIFVDMCTIAKVSLIVMDEPYHGFYLHCRSPHQYADGSMSELVSMLHKEEVGLTVDRSLEGAPPDVQSFEVFVTAEWRRRYDKICSTLVPPDTGDLCGLLSNAASTAASRRGQGRGSLGQNRATPTDRVIKAWGELNAFLQGFIENNFNVPDLRRKVKLPTYLEKLMRVPPDLTAPGQPCVFYPDEYFSYSSVLFLGRELDLLLLNVLSYAMFDLWFNSTATSILLCYLLDLLICKLRDDIGQNVIARKTLVDERFLT